MNHRFYIQSVVLNCQSFSILLERKMTVSYNEQILDGKRKTATDPLMLIFKEMISPSLKKGNIKTTYEMKKKKLSLWGNYIFTR